MMELVKTKKRRISVRSAKNKGIFLQKWVCKKISDLLNVEFNNQDDNSEIKSRPMGMSGPDVILSKEIIKRFPFTVECKSSEQWNILKSLNQAKKNTIKSTNYLLFIKNKKIKTPLVVLDANIFFDLLEKNKQKV